MIKSLDNKNDDITGLNRIKIDNKNNIIIKKDFIQWDFRLFFKIIESSFSIIFECWSLILYLLSKTGWNIMVEISNEEINEEINK